MVVELPGAIFRLHRPGAKGCWMGRRRIFRSTLAFPINPSIPMFAGYVGQAARRGRSQLVKPPQPCYEMGRR